MTKSDTSNSTSADFYREVRKLEVRLNDYLADEETFVKSLRDCIAHFKALHASIEKLNVSQNTEEKSEALKLKKLSKTAFSEALINQGKADHERSHLLESYGALISTLPRLKMVPSTADSTK
jgi:ATP-dependent helicase/DNAse subunit B